jgi:hypothetical protein
MHDKRITCGWRYGEHYFPHDIVHRELSTGRSRLDALSSLGIQATVVPESIVLDGINEVRKLLGRTWIDPVRCERGLEALRQYRREYDERLKDWKKNPLHDWTSHAADALRYFVLGFEESHNYPHSRSRPPRAGTSRLRLERMNTRPGVAARKISRSNEKCPFLPRSDQTGNLPARSKSGDRARRQQITPLLDHLIGGC